MSSKNIHPSFFSNRPSEIPSPPNASLSRLSFLASSFSKYFFEYINFFILFVEEEKQKSYQFITKAPSLQIIRNIFNSVSSPKGLVEEKKEVKEIHLLADLIRREEKKLGHIEDSPPLYEKKDSLFRKAGGAPSLLNLDTFSSLFGLNETLSTSSLKGLVDYVGNYFILQKKEKNLPLYALQQAIVEKGKFEKLVADKDDEALERRAEELAASMERIQEGNPFIYIGNICNRIDVSNPILSNIITQVLPEGELRSILLNCHDFLSSSSLQQTMQKPISRLFQNSESLADLQQLKEQLSKTMESTESSLFEAMGVILPKSWVTAVQKSIREDCKELLFGREALTNPENFAEKLWNQMDAIGLEDLVQTTLKDFCSKSPEIWKSLSREVTVSISRSLPDGATDLLRLDEGDATISIEIERQNDGKFRLILFSKPTSYHREHAKGVQLPLVYSDLDPKVLGKAFFFRLLSYQAFPKWEDSIGYSLDDFFEGLIANLEKEPSQVEKHTLQPFSTHQVVTSWSLTELFLSYHLKLERKEFQKILYDLRLQAFLEMWDETEVKENPLLKNTLQSALDRLVKDSLLLFEENLLSLDHLKAMDATVKEWDEITKKRGVKVTYLPKTTLPPILQEILGSTLTACEMTNQSIELVKEAFVDIFGKEIEEPLNFAVAEIIPTLPTKDVPALNKKEESWKDFFSGEVNTISSMRISLLSFYKLYARYSMFVSRAIELFASTKLLSTLLKTHVPLLATHEGAATLCAGLLSHFGPTLLSTILPENGGKLIASIYGFYHEVIGYIHLRISCFVMKQMIYHLLGSQKITEITHLIKKTQQALTRDGEISLEINKREEKPAIYHFEEGKIPLNLETKSVSHPTVDSLRSESITFTLTKDNLLPYLYSWIEKSKKAPFDLQCAYYLNSQIRNLPIPKQGNNPTLWDEIVDIPAVLESLHSLALTLHNKKEGGGDDEEYEETTVSLFAIYSIIDYLARRSQKAHLTDEWKPNGCDLIVLVNNPFFKIRSRRTYTQLESLAAYFDFDIRKRYTQEEIDEKRGECLFNYTGCGKRTFFDIIKNKRFPFLFETEGELILTNWSGIDYVPLEVKYYHRLLEDPAIQRKLEDHLGKGASYWEKYFCLFSDPILGKSDLTSESIRVLPRPFYLLRFMHALLSSRTRNRSINPTTELSFTPIKSPPLSIWPFSDDTVKKITEYLHSASFHSFRKISLDATIKGFVPSYSDYVHPRPFSLWEAETTRRTWREITSENREITSMNYIERLFYNPGSRKQDGIMRASMMIGLFNTNLPIDEAQKKVIEMVTSHKSDQVIRSISYFTHNLERLSDPKFKLILDLFIHNIGALQSQLSDHPEVTQVLGDFFHKGLNYFFRHQDYSTCLYLTVIGGTTLHLSEEFKKDAATYFPNFRSFIREKIIPALKSAPDSKRFKSVLIKNKTGRRINGPRIDLVMESLSYLASSYNHIHPSELSPSLFKEALIDIARFSFSRLSTPHSSRADKAFWTYFPLIRINIDFDPAMRRKLLESILMDGNIPLPQNYDGIWTGAFPEYQSSGLTVNLNANQSDHFDINTHVALRLGNPSISSASPFPLSETFIYYPYYQVYAEVITTDVCHITKTFFGQNGVKCRLTSCRGYTLEKIWVEENPKSEEFLVVFTEGSEMRSAYYAKHLANKEGFQLLSKCPINGETENTIDLTKMDHGLSLLAWFQPLEKIKAFSSIQNPEKITRIEFPNVVNGSDSSQELTFTIKNTKALSDGAFPGFSIASRQKNQDLISLSNYLLLENDNQEKKVLLVAPSPHAQLVSFFAKHFAGLSTSPFVENQLASFLSKEQNVKSEYFVYTLNKEGKLETSDPTALCYLFVHHFMHGNHEELLRILGELEMFGKLYPFPHRVLQLFKLLDLPFLTLQTDLINEVSLRLSSVQAENELFHPQEDSVSATSPYFLDYFLIQSKYVAYLTGLEAGKTPYLTEYQELFLLRKLEEKNKHIFRHRVIKEFVIDAIASRLFLPIIIRRSLYLRSKYSDENHLKIKGESLLQEIVFEIPSQSPLGIDGVTSSTLQKEEVGGKSTLAKIARATFKCASMPCSFIKEKDTLLWATSVSLDQKLEDLPLEIWEITPRAIRNNFPLYYRLASKSLAAEWKGNQEMETLFAKQVAIFQKTLTLLKGNYSNEPNIFIWILQIVAKRPPLICFPKAEELEDHIKRVKKYRSYEKKLFGTSGAEQKKHHGKITELRINGDPTTTLTTFFDHLIASCRKGDISCRLSSKQTALITLDIGLSTLKWFAPTLLLSALGMNEYAAIYQTAVFGIGLLRRVKKMSSEQLPPPVPKEISKVPKEDLPPSLAESMKQKEGQINFVMDELFAKYFLEDEQNGESALPLAQIPPFTQHGEEESVQETFSKLNKSVKDYYARPQEVNNGCLLKEGKDPLKLKKKISAMHEAIFSHLKLEEQEILSLVNPNLAEERVSESERIKNRLKKLIQRQAPLTFLKVCILFARGKEEELLKRKGVTRESLEIIKEKLYFRLLLLSRFNLLAKTAKEKEAIEIGKELKRRRVYSFDNIPEKLVRGKLLFEANQQVLLWDKPNRKLDELLFSPHKQSVLELIMASGKSFFVIPEVSDYEADGSQLICNIWPAPVAKNAISFIGAQAKKVYSQTASAFQCNRSIQWSLSSLWAIFQVFRRTLVAGEQMNATKEDMQAFELRFIEEGLDVNKSFCKDSNWKERLSYYMKTLGLIRKNGKGNIDEPHVQFDPKKELNHPVGKEVRLKEAYTDLMKEILLLLVTIPEIQNVLGIKNKKPSSVDPEVFKERVLPILASHTVKIASLKIPTEHQKQLISYLMGKETKIPSFVLKSSEKSLIGLAKGMLTVLLPMSLERIAHVDYATSKKGNGEYARPSEGNENPSEISNIRNPYEAFVKTGLLKLCEGLTDENINNFIIILQNKGLAQERETRTPFQNTPYAKLFNRICPNYDLLNVFTLRADEERVVFDTLKKSDVATLTYVDWIIGPEIKYYLHNLKSDSHNFASMFHSYYSYDGSPNKEGCFPYKTHVHWDKGTTGESIDFLVKECSIKSISVLKKEAPEEVLDEVIADFFQKDPNMRTIIDRGAIFNGISNEKVASRLLQHIERDRKDLEGVVFYNIDKELVILEKGAKKPILLEESRIAKEKRITYFDQCHTYAADVPQKQKAKAVISVGENLTLEELTQAIWRMRGLKNSEQKLTFVMTEKVKTLICSGKSPTIEEIIKFAARNEARLLAEYNYFSDQQKLQNIVRRAILDKIIFAKNVDQALAIMQEFKDVLMTKVEDDPFLLYGFIDTFEEPKTLLDELRSILSSIIEKSSTFTSEEKFAINTDLNQIGNATYPKEIHAYKMGDKLYGNNLDDLGKTTQIETDGSCEREDDVNIEVDQKKQEQVQAPVTNGRNPSFWPWPKNLIPSDLTWLKVSSIPGPEGIVGGLFYYFSRIKRSYENVPIFSLKEALHSAIRPSLKEIAPAFDSSILGTNNFFQLIDVGMKGGYVDPYSKLQKPTFEALIIQEEKNGKKERRILLLDQEEAEYWRNKLKEEKEEENLRCPGVKLGVYDLISKTLVITGKNPLTNIELFHPLFEGILLQVNFLSGRVAYTREEQKILLPWLKKNNPDKLKDAFLDIHEHHGLSPFIGSDLEYLFFMAKGASHEQSIRV